MTLHELRIYVRAAPPILHDLECLASWGAVFGGLYTTTREIARMRSLLSTALGI